MTLIIIIIIICMFTLGMWQSTQQFTLGLGRPEFKSLGKDSS